MRQLANYADYATDFQPLLFWKTNFYYTTSTPEFLVYIPSFLSKISQRNKNNEK